MNTHIYIYIHRRIHTLHSNGSRVFDNTNIRCMDRRHPMQWTGKGCFCICVKLVLWWCYRYTIKTKVTIHILRFQTFRLTLKRTGWDKKLETKSPLSKKGVLGGIQHNGKRWSATPWVDPTWLLSHQGRGCPQWETHTCRENGRCLKRGWGTTSWKRLFSTPSLETKSLSCEDARGGKQW